MMPEDMGTPGYTVVSMEPDRALVTHVDDENASSWVWVLDPIDAETTRLIVRFRQKWEPGMMGLAIWIGDELGSLLMQPRDTPWDKAAGRGCNRAVEGRRQPDVRRERFRRTSRGYEIAAKPGKQALKA